METLRNNERDCGDVLLEARNLKKYFTTPNGILHAVDDVSFSIKRGTTLGVVGESGCGKSTLGLVLLHLETLTDGQIIFKGEDVTRVRRREIKNLRKNMQMIFQDPFSSLNPRISISEIIAEPLHIYKAGSRQEIDKRVDWLMDIVGLASRLKGAYPHELDGGRRQRVGVARALAMNPEFIVCDEPVSALDVSIQAQILNLLQDLQKELKLTYIFITHDLSVVKHISDEICVMYLGQVVERSPSKELFKNPQHPYTQALISAIPKPKVPPVTERIVLKGELSSPIEPKPGCRFAPRCLYACERCFSANPGTSCVGEGHTVSCILAEKV